MDALNNTILDNDDIDSSALYNVNSLTMEDDCDLESALALRKNLNLTAFENTLERSDRNKENTDASNSRPASASSLQGRRLPVKSQKMEQNWQKAIQQTSSFNNTLPPTHPSSSSANNHQDLNHNTIGNIQRSALASSSNLSVILRVRPVVNSKGGRNKPSTVVVTDETTGSVLYDTLEILPNQATIRTFAPCTSNAHKSHRRSSSTGSVHTGMSGDDVNEQAVVKQYEFEKVLGPNTSQEDVYKSTAAPLIHGLFNKNSGLIFSYGFSNAGKTYTVMGKSKDKADWGLLPRALKDILRRIKKTNENVEDEAKKFSLSMSYLEIHNEMIFDLLDQKATKSWMKQKSLKIIDNGGNAFVKDLSKYTIKSVDQAMKTVIAANQKRKTGSNTLNNDSSRSHSICQLEIMFGNDSTFSTLWVVDLAGSERSKRTGLVGTPASREAAQINTSLMTLMRCINQIVANQKTEPASDGNINLPLVPFRESKLTHLFMSHLSNSSETSGKTVMIVNVNPSAADFDETQQVLSYATIAKDVRVNANCYILNSLKKRSSSASTCDDERSVRSKKATRVVEKKVRSTKISNLVKRFSPKGLKRPSTSRGENNDDTKHVTKKHRFVLSPTKKKKEVDSLKEENEKIKEKSIKLEKEIEALLSMNSKLKEENHRHLTSIHELKDEMVEKEKEIRADVAEQMEEMIFAQQAKARVRSPEMKLLSDPTPFKSMKKLREEKQEKRILELLEKIDEAEEENQRMKEYYENRINRLEEELMIQQEAEFERDMDMEEEGEDFSNDEESQACRRDTIVQRGRLLTSTRNDDNKVSMETNVEVDTEVPEGETRIVRLPRNRSSSVACEKELQILQDSEGNHGFEEQKISPAKKVKDMIVALNTICSNKSAKEIVSKCHAPESHDSAISLHNGSFDEVEDSESVSTQVIDPMEMSESPIKNFDGKDSFFSNEELEKDHNFTKVREGSTETKATDESSAVSFNCSDSRNTAAVLDVSSDHGLIDSDEESEDYEEEDIIYPENKTSRNRKTGLWARPKGRAPSGRKWNNEKGGWELK